MLVCQCNVITDKEIKQIILELLRVDPWQIIVPAMVYRELNKRCKCAGCVPNVVDIILSVTEEYHLHGRTAARRTPPGSRAAFGHAS